VRILIHSNGPHVKTGYGVQTRQLSEHLHDAGHDVAVSCTYGVQGEILPFGKRQILLYPAGYEVNGNDIIHSHALHHFGGDATGGWIIPLLDMWCLQNPILEDFNIAAWTPVDHVPVPSDVVKFFHRNPDAVPVAMSRFGERQLSEAGLNPVYIPLTVDTTVYKPTEHVVSQGQTLTGRQLIAMSDGPPDPIPDDAFLVGMVAMNKGWARDRKGFNEAFRAFGQFWQHHQNAILYVHADWPGGAEGINLKELAVHAAIPEHAIRFVDQYAYRMGYSPEMMAAIYTAFDVLLAPSHGEGFGVPLIEAQACGTPVITSDFSTGPELCGAGWLVAGQLEWDPPQHASYLCPYTAEVIRALEECFAADRTEMVDKAVGFASQYDADLVFVQYWMPFLESLEKPPEGLQLDRKPMGQVDVLVPYMRPENASRFWESLTDEVAESDVIVYIAESDAESRPVRTFAQNLNDAYRQGSNDWVLVVGDDVEFKPGWLDAAKKLSDRFDVIGTNDSSNGVKNPDVAAGRHADHFFVRRSYIDTYGASLDGPGVLAPEIYGHWYTDKEIVELAKARGVWTPCLDSVIEHHHPGYAGREDLRQADSVYVKAQETAEEDKRTFVSRSPLIEMQRTSRGKK
jgi:glycosyltransferase involved in cell wall biosynthesis